MSAGAVGIEKTYLVNSNNNSNNNNTNNAYECINVDINSILKDINSYKKARKRNVRNLYDDYTNCNDEDKITNKKVKLENFVDIKTEDDGSISQDEEGEDMHIASDDSSENKNEKHGSEMENGHTNKEVNSNKRRLYEDPNETHINETKVDANNSVLIEENEKKMSNKISMCIDNVIESIRFCNEIGQAKKIITPILNNFIRNNFIYVDGCEKDPYIHKKKFDTLCREKKILKSAVKWQYQMIRQSQKVIDNQKVELRKKNDELNQIKAKVHQYFYELNNPNKETFQPCIYPDVY